MAWTGFPLLAYRRAMGQAEGTARVGWKTHLEFWDVIFALIGFAVAGALRTFVLHGYSVLWWGGPLAFVVARRAWLPGLSPTRDGPRTAPSLGRRVAAYTLMVLGGFVGLIAGGVFYVLATDADHPQFAWPALLVVGVGVLIATPGVRWVT